MAQNIGARSVRGTGTGAGHDHGRDHGRDKTLAQKYALIVGAVLLLVGLLGFIADATFDTGLTGTDDDGGNQGGALQGDSFLGFEVNGWHNVVHVLSGVFLLSFANKWRAAKTAVLAFGVIYLLVTIIGLIDGNDVLGLIPVNPADNILHIVLSLTAIAVGVLSDPKDRSDHSA